MLLKSRGTIIHHLADFYYVDVKGNVIETKAKGKFRLDKAPLVGDHVLVDLDISRIEEIYPRKNRLVRPAVANVDVLLIFVAIMNPKPDYLMIDKLIVNARFKNIEPVIVVNKMDLCSDTLETNYEVPVYYISTIDKQNIDQLKKHLQSGIYVLAGPSGAGKSSFINEIKQNSSLKTGIISQKSKRGKHTTRSNLLLPLGDDIWIADTPGFQNIQLDEQIEPRDLADLFYHSDCKFNNCLHLNEPGCSVQRDVKEGQLDPKRYENYVYMQNELQRRKRW